MKKLALAISVVFCVQLAFTAYNAGEAGRREFARVVAMPVTAPFHTKDPLADIQGAEDEAFDLDTEEIETDAVVRQVAKKPAAHTRKFRRNSVVTYDRTFATTKIVVPKAEKFEFKTQDEPESKVAAFTATRAPRTVVSALTAEKPSEKRSILDKTGSVIKKPFRWIKDLFARN